MKDVRHDHLDDGEVVGTLKTGRAGSGSLLVIDDDEATLGLLTDLLEMNGFQAQPARGGREGLDLFETGRFDLVITDIRMPQVDGLEVLRKVSEIDETVPVILVTGYGDLENALRALRIGAYDFLLKPINPEILLNTAKKGLDHGRLKRFEKDYRLLLEDTVEARTKDLVKSYRTIKKIQGASVFALARLAESRDGETGFHLRRIQEYCQVLCRQLSLHSRYRDLMTDEFIENLVQCSVLHDIGKVAVPDNILFCPGKFSDAQFTVMKQHAEAGGKALEEAATEVGEQNNYLFMGRDIAYWHHERWDGSGYPCGLEGEDIPLAARIVALADVYDALTTARRYKPAFGHNEAREEIGAARGLQFDPEIVEAFLEAEEEFKAIRERLSGEGEKDVAMASGGCEA
ncbi:MAG: response regulator [Desulfomonile tiedjei]|nr:response regulator [Desulfomonile tiedjei]